MSDIQLNPPRAFVIGSTLQFRVNAPDYVPPTWTGEFALVSTSDAQQFPGTDNGDSTHLFTLTAAQTAGFAIGLYRFQINVTSGVERHTVLAGSVEALGNYAAITGGLDDRSSAAKIYDAISAMMEGKATHDQSSLAVGGRSLSRYSWPELMEARGHYAHAMSDEERMNRGFSPRGPRTIRFTR